MEDCKEPSGLQKKRDEDEDEQEEEQQQQQQQHMSTPALPAPSTKPDLQQQRAAHGPRRHEGHQGHKPPPASHAKPSPTPTDQPQQQQQHHPLFRRRDILSSFCRSSRSPTPAGSGSLHVFSIPRNNPPSNHPSSSQTSPTPQILTQAVIRALLAESQHREQQRRQQQQPKAIPFHIPPTTPLPSAAPCGMPPSDNNTNSPPPPTTPPKGLRYQQYDVKTHEERYLPLIRQLISKDLSEPYSIYVYRYFLYQWADLCFMALDDDGALVGVIVCKLEPHRAGPLRGYIAMLAVTQQHRGHGIATRLVRLAIDIMVERDADEVALETEITNTPSLRLYESLGFLRSKRLHRYYLNGNAAFRLVLYLKNGISKIPTQAPEYPADDPASLPLAASSTSQELALNGSRGAAGEA